MEVILIFPRIPASDTSLPQPWPTWPTWRAKGSPNAQRQAKCFWGRTASGRMASGVLQQSTPHRVQLPPLLGWSNGGEYVRTKPKNGRCRGVWQDIRQDISWTLRALIPFFRVSEVDDSTNSRKKPFLLVCVCLRIAAYRMTMKCNMPQSAVPVQLDPTRVSPTHMSQCRTHPAVPGKVQLDP